MEDTLLGRDEPPAFGVDTGASPFVLVCDHAGQRLPRKLGALDLSSRELETHIAWDIGALQVARALAALLKAFVAWQPYSRLVIDCNRPLGADDSIARQSGGVFIPGNQNLLPGAIDARTREIFFPYHAGVAAEIARRLETGLPCFFVSIHSFTPVLSEVVRPWQVGVLSNRDRRLAEPLLRLLRAEGDLIVGDNEPYAASEATDFSIVHHAERHGIAYVEIELRQDLIRDEPGQMAWAKRLARLLPIASRNLVSPASPPPA